MCSSHLVSGCATNALSTLPIQFENEAPEKGKPEKPGPLLTRSRRGDWIDSHRAKLVYENPTKMKRDGCTGSARIRERYLRKLGFVHGENKVSGERVSNAKLRGGQGRQSSSDNFKIATLTEPLKFDDITECTAATSLSSPTFFPSSLDSFFSRTSSFDQMESSAKHRKPGISFNDTVSVQLIPMRNEYSERVKQCLWSNPGEMCVNASRNAVEFAFEGWDWRNATEDCDMILNSETGELIHPVHCSQLYAQTQCLPFLEHSRRAALEWTMRK